MKPTGAKLKIKFPSPYLDASPLRRALSAASIQPVKAQEPGQTAPLDHRAGVRIDSSGLANTRVHGEAAKDKEVRL